MAYKCSFLDNQEYTAQDVNEIFARVTCGGVLFNDTGDAFGDLNGAAGSLSTEGITRDPDSCRVKRENGVYKISKGACIMKDGSAITFDSNGYEIEVPEGQYTYVYLRRNFVENSIDIVVSAHPGDEDSIPLAEVDIKGGIYDRRVYAKAKADIGEAGTLRNFTVHFKECRPTKSETLTIDLGNEMFSYIIMWDGESVAYLGSVAPRVATGRNLLQLVDGEEILFSIGNKYGEQTERIRCTKDGQLLHLYLSEPTPSANYTLNLGVI